MRFADLLRLSLSALWQQKLRGLLTTLGVVFGAFVLVFSLSLGQGVQSTLERESHRSVFLRKIIVHPGWQGSDTGEPAEEVPVPGDMSEDKRQRLRRALTDRKLNYSSQPRVLLTEDRLQTLGKLDHVVSVTPLVQQAAWAIRGNRSVQVSTFGVDPDSADYRQRLIAGDFFQQSNERSLIINELTCYLLGVTDEADQQRLLGTKLRLEFRGEPTSPVGLNIWLYKGDGSAPTLQEQTAVDKIRQQLPTALNRLDLSEGREGRSESGTQETARDDQRASKKTSPSSASFACPPRRSWSRRGTRRTVTPTFCSRGKRLRISSFTRQNQSAVGVGEATILVDNEANVRDVLQRVTAMKLQAYAPIEYIERERFIYLLIFTTMACVAAVALLVAALGIANTMLMSVLERTREIGIFKAVGAGDGTVQLVFLIEGAFIGLIGGGLGLLLGWAGSYPADAWVRSMVSRDLKIELKESLFVFPWWLTVGVIVFAVVVTTLAAVFPARRAARVNPVTALRNE